MIIKICQNLWSSDFSERASRVSPGHEDSRRGQAHKWQVASRCTMIDSGQTVSPIYSSSPPPRRVRPKPSRCLILNGKTLFVLFVFASRSVLQFTLVCLVWWLATGNQWSKSIKKQLNTHDTIIYGTNQVNPWRTQIKRRDDDDK